MLGTMLRCHQWGQVGPCTKYGSGLIEPRHQGIPVNIWDCFFDKLAFFLAYSSITIFRRKLSVSQNRALRLGDSRIEKTFVCPFWKWSEVSINSPLLIEGPPELQRWRRKIASFQVAKRTDVIAETATRKETINRSFWYICRPANRSDTTQNRPVNIQA